MRLRISIVGEKDAVQLGADANALLAAILGGKAKLAFESEEVAQLFTTETTFAEVEEYALVLARKRHLSPDLPLLTLASLPVSIASTAEYSGGLSEARRRISRRDPDDVDVFALALHLRLPLWSNDRDFEGTGVELLTTQDVLRNLRLI